MCIHIFLLYLMQLRDEHTKLQDAIASLQTAPKTEPADYRLCRTISALFILCRLSEAQNEPPAVEKRKNKLPIHHFIFGIVFMLKKNVSSIALCIVYAMGVSSVQATELTFKGTIVAQTCKVDGVDASVSVSMPTMGISDVSDLSTSVGVTSVSIPVSCEGEAESGKVGAPVGDGTVTMTLMPYPGSFSGKVLNNTAKVKPATGVGISVLDKNLNPIDFGAGDGSAIITAPMVAGKANVVVSARYTKSLVGADEEVTAGAVEAVLPFVMTYE